MSEKKKTAVTNLKKSNQFFADILSTDFSKTEATEKQTNHAISTEDTIVSNENIIIEIHPKQAKNWQFNDRLEADMGDLNALAHDMKLNGQIEPCIVRKSPSASHDYEIIAGERRWRAAKMAGITLKAIVKNLTNDQAAIIQAAENLNRQDLSDYAIGMSYAKLLSTGTLKQIDLIERVGLSQLQINRYMAFSQIPSVIWEKIINPVKISARTAAEMRALSKKGDNYINALIQLAPKLREGKIGAANLKREVSKMLTNKNKKLESSQKVFDIKSTTGDTVLKCKIDKKSNQLSFMFPKELRANIDSNEFLQSIVDFISGKFNQ